MSGRKLAVLIALSLGALSSTCAPSGAAAQPADGVLEGGGVYRATLDEAIARAVDVSPQLRFAMRSVELASGRYLRERRAYFPAFTLSASSETAVTPLSPDRRSRRVALGVRQTIYDGGALARARAAKAADIALRRSDAVAGRAHTRAQAWRTLTAYELAGEREKIFRLSLERARDAERIAGEQHALGRLSDSRLSEARLAAAEAAGELNEARLALREAHFAATRILGLPVESGIELRDGFSPEASVPPVERAPAELAEIALRDNPEMRRKRLSLHRAREEAYASRRTLVPSISANVDLSLAAQTLPLRDPDIRFALEFAWHGDTPVSAGASAGAGPYGEVRRGATISSEPLRSITGSYDRAEAELEAERAAFAAGQEEQDLRFAVHRELERLELSLERQKIARRRADLEAERLSVVEAEVELGRARPIDLLTASQSHREGALALIEATREVLERRRSIDELVGRPAQEW